MKTLRIDWKVIKNIVKIDLSNDEPSFFDSYGYLFLYLHRYIVSFWHKKLLPVYHKCISCSFKSLTVHHGLSDFCDSFQIRHINCFLPQCGYKIYTNLQWSSPGFSREIGCKFKLINCGLQQVHGHGQRNQNKSQSVFL